MLLQLEALQFYYVGTNETEDVDIDDFYDGVSLYALLTITIGRFREVNEGRAPPPPPYIFFELLTTGIGIIVHICECMQSLADGRGLSENTGREYDGPNGKT